MHVSGIGCGNYKELITENSQTNGNFSSVNLPNIPDALTSSNIQPTKTEINATLSPISEEHKRVNSAFQKINTVHSYEVKFENEKSFKRFEEFFTFDHKNSYHEFIVDGRTVKLRANFTTKKIEVEFSEGEETLQLKNMEDSACSYCHPRTVTKYDIPFEKRNAFLKISMFFETKEYRGWVCILDLKLHFLKCNYDYFTPDEDIIIPPLDENSFKEHLWEKNRIMDLSTIDSVEKQFEYYKFQYKPDLTTGDVTITILESENPICISVNGVVTYGEKDKAVNYTVLNSEKDRSVYVYRLERSLQWKPLICTDFTHCKFKPAKEAFFKIPPQNNDVQPSDVVESHQMQRSHFSGLEAWDKTCNYVIDIGGLNSQNIYGVDRILDFKVLLYSSLSEGRHSEIINLAHTYKEEAHERLDSKKASLCCYQFCMLMYMHEGILDIAELTKAQDYLENCEEITFPFALHFEKCAVAQTAAQKSEMLQKASRGDLLSFANNIYSIAHVTIFLGFNPETEEYTRIEILDYEPIKIVTEKLDDREIFILTKSSDVQHNISEFNKHAEECEDISLLLPY